MRARRGVALFAALALMVVIGLLAGGAVAASTMSQRSLRMARTDALLTASANYGLNTLLSAPWSYNLADLPLGGTRRITVSNPDAPPDSVIVSATRLPAGVLWLVAVAEFPGPEAGARRFNMVARFPAVGPMPPAGIVSRGNVRVGSNVVTLRDTSVDAECDRPSGADFIVAPGATVQQVPVSADTLRVVISPSVADSTAYFQTARQLAVLDSGGRVVHVRGDTTIVGGTFNGILIVDGTLTVNGPFQATGLIVARGRVVAVTGGFAMNGSLLSFATVGPNPAVDLAAASVLFSPCAVSRAFRLALPPRPVPKRSWAEMF